MVGLLRSDAMSEQNLVSDVLIVGGGLSGLAAGLGLARSGRRVRVLEASTAVGGRARTEWWGGRPVDRGFQVTFSAYPAFRKFVTDIGIPKSDLRPFTDGGAFFDGAQWGELSSSPLSLLKFSAMDAADRVRFVRLAAEIRFASASRLLARDQEAATTEAFLLQRGFSNASIDRVFRPLFGVIFLDRSLSADPGYFLFLLSMLVRGPSVLPSDGLGMVGEWAAGAIRQGGGDIRTGVRVAGLVRDPDSGRMTGAIDADGGLYSAAVVILAVDAPAARTLLADHDAGMAARIPSDGASVTSARFALRSSLYQGRKILLNAAPESGVHPRIDLVCQTTNVNRHEAVGGPHIVVATSVGDSDTTAAGIEDALERQIHRWFPEFPWSRVAESIGVVRHPFAQFRPLAGVRRSLPGTRTNVPNLLLAGEYTMHPSLEGAVSSGVTAAEIAERQLG